MMVNLNSFVDVEYILDQYKKLHGISEAQEWVALGRYRPLYWQVNLLKQTPKSMTGFE